MWNFMLHVLASSDTYIINIGKHSKEFKWQVQKWYTAHLKQLKLTVYRLLLLYYCHIIRVTFFYNSRVDEILILQRFMPQRSWLNAKHAGRVGLDKSKTDVENVISTMPNFECWIKLNRDKRLRLTTRGEAILLSQDTVMTWKIIRDTARTNCSPRSQIDPYI